MRRTLFLLRRAVRDCTHAQHNRNGERGGGEGAREGWRIGAPGVPISTRASSSRHGRYDDDLVNGGNLLFFNATLTDGRTFPFFSFFLLFWFRRTTGTLREYFGAAFTRGRARARTHARGIDTRRRWIAGGTRRLLQPGRSSRPVRGRVCHCTGTRAAANIHSPFLSSNSYAVYPLLITRRGTERSDDGRGERPVFLRRARLASRLAVRASLRRGSSAPSRVDRCAHRAADNAVVTTASVHSTRAMNAERGE